MSRRRGAAAGCATLARLGLLSLLLHGGSLAAQVVDLPRRDTVRPGELPVDTIAPDTAEAEPAPLIRFPAMALAPAVALAGTEWVWDREALLREAPVSLVDLLARIPAVAALRAGMFAQPEAASAFGGTAARVEIEVDGFILDPLSAATFDLSQLPLTQLREVRVERRLGLLRIRLLTDESFEGQPYTRVEAGIGQPPANLFRGLFLVPYAVFGPLSLGIERLDTDGTGRAEPADVFSGWAKWAWTDGSRGVQFELFRTTLGREPRSPWPVERVRQDIIVRARNRFTPDLVAEIYGGRSQLEETLPAAPGDTAEESLQRESIQAGLRTAWTLPFATLSGALRYRDAPGLPRLEATLAADAAFGPARVAAELGRADPGEQAATTYSGLRAEVGQVLGATVFGELTTGGRVAPAYTDSGPAAIVDDRSGWRAGLALDLGRAAGSVAWIEMDQDRALPFGLPFDRAAAPLPTGTARGVEAHGRLRLFGDLAVESWMTNWVDARNWTYLPARSWRTALELHTLPLPSGNLEILARAEAVHRSGMLAFDPEGAAGGGSAARPMPPWTTAHIYLQIRVIDVRMFLRWEDLPGAGVEDLPGRVQRGPRIFYGVKWDLWN